MVRKEIDERTAIKFGILFSSTLLMIIFVIALITVSSVQKVGDVEDFDGVQPVPNTAFDGPVEVLMPDKIDFQSTVDEWVKTTTGNRSVLIYDLDRDEIAGAYNSSEKYSIDSLYKLFVVYEGYRRVQSGEWNSSDSVEYTGYTVLDCLDLAIRESNSVCAEMLWSMIGEDKLDQIVSDDFEITNSDVSSFISNAEDVAKMMKIYYEHKDIKDDSLMARMKDSFLNQPVTEYDWRQGLPKGFSTANVYNKVGWDYNVDEKYWNTYHDAAIVEFPEQNRHFIVVVMTSHVSFNKISNLGSMIESTFKAS